MRKTLIFFICFGVIACSTFCLAEEAGEAKVVEAQVGENFTITLESNATTGYAWQLAKPLDESMLKLVNSEYLAPKTQLVGAGGKHVWVLKALKAGKADIFLKYARPWEKDNPPGKEASFVIFIK